MDNLINQLAKIGAEAAVCFGIGCCLILKATEFRGWMTSDANKYVFRKRKR